MLSKNTAGFFSEAFLKAGNLQQGTLQEFQTKVTLLAVWWQYYKKYLPKSKHKWQGRNNQLPKQHCYQCKLLIRQKKFN